MKHNSTTHIKAACLFSDRGVFFVALRQKGVGFFYSVGMSCGLFKAGIKITGILDNVLDCIERCCAAKIGLAYRNVEDFLLELKKN